MATPRGLSRSGRHLLGAVYRARRRFMGWRLACGACGGAPGTSALIGVFDDSQAHVELLRGEGADAVLGPAHVVAVGGCRG